MKIQFKKAQAINEEIILIMISLVVIGLSLYFSTIYLGDSTSKLNSVENISYEFPSIFVHSFLEFPIQDDDLKELGLNSGENKYRIKDLIYLNSEKSKAIVEKYRQEYIIESNSALNDNQNMHYLFQKFSGDKYEVSPDNLLIFKYVDSLGINSLESEIIKNNYYYYLKLVNNKFVVIYFKEDLN